MGLRARKTPPLCPKANSLCERVIGTLHRECLDFLIPLTENHLRIVTKDWIAHHNRGRPMPVSAQEFRHRLQGYPLHYRNIGILIRTAVKL